MGGVMPEFIDERYVPPSVKVSDYLTFLRDFSLSVYENCISDPPRPTRLTYGQFIEKATNVRRFIKELDSLDLPNDVLVNSRNPEIYWITKYPIVTIHDICVRCNITSLVILLGSSVTKRPENWYNIYCSDRGPSGDFTSLTIDIAESARFWFKQGSFDFEKYIMDKVEHEKRWRARRDLLVKKLRERGLKI
jgi:hypothetical protein